MTKPRLSDALTEPLLWQYAVFRRAACSLNFLVVLYFVLGLGFGVLLIPVLQLRRGKRGEHLDAQDSTTVLAVTPPYEPGALSEYVMTSYRVQMPRLIYGVAWKKERTEELVVSAVRSGFRGFDTASAKDYYEPGVGAALRSLPKLTGVAREALFIQARIDPTAELSPGAPVSKLVEQAIAKALFNLKLEYVDSLMLQSPYSSHEQTMEAWHEMERAHETGLARQLGISNLGSLDQLQSLYLDARQKPAVVQQRFYAETGFEQEMRAWCAKIGIVFQSFWTLTANRRIIDSLAMQSLAKKYGVTPPVLFYRYVMGLGVTPLDGTAREEHMKEDLTASRVPLTVPDADIIHDLLRRRLDEDQCLVPRMEGFNIVDTKQMVHKVPGIEIVGDAQQMLHITLAPGERCWAEPGCLVHCDNEVQSQVDVGTGGFCGFFKRVFFAGDSAFRVHWENTDSASPKMVGLGANFPAKVVPVNLDDWGGVVFVKRHAFLAGLDPNLKFSIESAGRRVGGTFANGLFGGQGFVLNKIKGRSWIFLNAAGAIFQKTLAADETIVVDRMCAVAWQNTCHFSFRVSGGMAMMCCGGEGLTETVLRGPGKVIMQSMPFEKTKALYSDPDKG